MRMERQEDKTKEAINGTGESHEDWGEVHEG